MIAILEPEPIASGSLLQVHTTLPEDVLWLEVYYACLWKTEFQRINTPGSSS